MKNIISGNIFPLDTRGTAVSIVTQKSRIMLPSSLHGLIIFLSAREHHNNVVKCHFHKRNERTYLLLCIILSDKLV